MLLTTCLLLATTAPWAPITLDQTITGFTTPVDIVAQGKRLFVVQQDGFIKVVDDGKVSTWLDARSVVGKVGGEQGLLGLAFKNDRTFIAYTDAKENDAVAELHGNDMKTLKVLFAINDFAPNHNGGNLVFGADGFLWVGTGDGGGAGDPQRTAQNPDVLLGKMLRVDVDAKKIRPEVTYLGLRNPWRYSFDKKTGDLWIADVGQDLWEEIDFVAAADLMKKHNFGWSILEGNHCFRPKQNCTPPPDYTAPIWEYGHGADGGCSVTGGFVYRGRKYPALQGSYVVADFCSGRIWELKRTPTGVDVALADESKVPVTSFGEDADGELWVADYSGSIKHVAVKP
jgi:glucose/arabinose dehydrogenase